MPRTIEIQGWIHMSPNPHANPPCDFTWWQFDEWPDSVMLMPHTVRFELPDGFEPTPVLIEQLRRQQQSERAAAERKCRAIEEKIHKLQALTLSEAKP